MLRQECNNNIQITITNTTARSAQTGYLQCHDLASGVEQAGIVYSTTSCQAVEGRVEPVMGSDDQAGRIESERVLDTEPAVRVVAVSRQENSF